MENIMVSICCLAYNQEQFIAQTLQSFVDQKTTFPIEILIHDDASTDATPQIIRQFEEKYPELIKPIYQTENQYSKKIPISRTYQFPRAKGKYIAFCEGDDYWIDPDKLQKQVDYMESHPDCTLCFTNGKCEIDGTIQRRVVPWVAFNRSAYKPGGGDYNMGEMVDLDYVPTASLLCLTEHLKETPELAPNTFRGDTYIRLYTTNKGYAHFIDEDTCVYRFQVPNSMTTQWSKSSAKSIAFQERLLLLMEEMNRLSEGKYAAQINDMKLRCQFKILMCRQDYRSARKKQFHKLFRKDGAREYIKYLLTVYTPRLFQVIHNVKNKLTGK